MQAGDDGELEEDTEKRQVFSIFELMKERSIFELQHQVLAKLKVPACPPQTNRESMDVLVKCSDMIYNGKECRILLIRDVSQVKENAKLNAEFKMLSLMASSVSHEMLTPMRCIINLTKGIEKRLTDYIK